jgi:hypothetical protein
MDTRTEYRNGGVVCNLLRLMTQNGRPMTSDEALAVAAHDAMPRGQWYTETQVRAKRAELQNEQQQNSTSADL